MKITSKILAFALAAVLLIGGVSVPASAADGGLPIDIAVDTYCILVLKSDGALWRMGYVYDMDTGESSYSSVKIADNVSKIVEGYIIKKDGSLWHCDIYSRNPDDWACQEKIADNVRSVSYGGGTTLVVKNDDSLWGMGEGWMIDSKDPGSGRLVPLTKIMDGVADAHCGSGGTAVYTAILKTDGSLWLRNFSYLNAINEIATYYYKGEWKLLDGVAAITHRYPLLALKTDGSLWVAYEVLESYDSATEGFELTGGTRQDNFGNSDGKTYTTTIRKPFRQLDEVADFAVGARASGAIKKDGGVWTWGSSALLGDGSLEGRLWDDEYTLFRPQKTMIEDVHKVAYSIGDRMALAVKKDGSIWAWGTTLWQLCGFEYRQGTLVFSKNPTPSEETIIPKPIKLADSADALISMFPVLGGQQQPAPAITATPTASTVLVNGKTVAFDAYTINGNNYFKLRDLAYILNGSAKQFDVGWDGANNAISLTNGKPYTAVGGEMTGKGAGNKTPTATSSKIYLDGKEVSFTAYTIDGNNYFKLRDIGQTFDFGVTWDGAKNTIVIDTSKGYTPE